ncbi:MAG TPA: cytochrome c [Candidatus Binataceae bacterium]|nr:cytochrome c [Candidatus Binataceae bacterium]
MIRRAERRTIRVIVAGVVLAYAAAAGAAGGSQVFASNCMVCHQADAKGVPGIYPPLADTIGSYVRFKAGRAYLAHVPSFGLAGQIDSHGESFDNDMPPLTQLSDADIAAVIGYVLTRFNQSLLPGDFKPLTADEVHRYRASHMEEADVYRERAALLGALKQAGDLK